jgi:hypothetical protein
MHIFESEGKKAAIIRHHWTKFSTHRETWCLGFLHPRVGHKFLNVSQVEQYFLAQRYIKSEGK